MLDQTMLDWMSAAMRTGGEFDMVLRFLLGMLCIAMMMGLPAVLIAPPLGLIVAWRDYSDRRKRAERDLRKSGDDLS